MKNNLLKYFVLSFIILVVLLEYFLNKGIALYKKERFPSKLHSFNRAKNFIEMCFKKININKGPFTNSKNPRVSAIIPVYNSRNYVERAIKSIQNQDLLDIEIILVNDFSIDDTLSIIEKIQQEDSRIKIINNKKNMGILYSRSIGALSAKGKYIFSLDNDDIFLDYDIFSSITNIADKGNFDIIEFMAIHADNEFTDIFKTKISTMIFYNPHDNEVLFQPKLGNYPIKLGDTLGSIEIRTVYLWTKCIRTKVYQKGLNKVGKERYSRFMTKHEDLVATCIIFNEANSYKFISKYGVLYLPRKESASRKENNAIEMVRCDLYWTDIAIDVTLKTKENQMLVVYFMANLIGKKNLEATLNETIYNKNLFISCLDRFFNSNIISKIYKNEIKERIKKLNFINYTL